MNFRNIEKVSDYKVVKWLEDELKLTDYQKEKIRDNESIRFSPFIFMTKRKTESNMFKRISIIFYPLVWLILFIFYPLTYVFMGRWGYGKKFNFIMNWMTSF